MSKKVVLIVGPSGVGKDTLLTYAKKNLQSDNNFNFVKRYITRKPDTNESNFYIQDEAFNILEKNNYFISTWQAYENLYGISKFSIEDKVNIISISRSKIADFEKYFDDVTTININISKELLKKRLEKRGRESLNEIENRLKRDYKNINAKNIIEFDNSKEIEKSASSFISLLKSFN